MRFFRRKGAVTSETPARSPLLVPGTLALVKTDEWFMAPDGGQYAAAWGPAYVLRALDLFGFEPRQTANWYVQIGEGRARTLLIAGCRVHYAIACDEPPSGNAVYVP